MYININVARREGRGLEKLLKEGRGKREKEKWKCLKGLKR